MKAISLFSGVGGFDLGAERAGIQIVAQVEKDKQARAILQRHWPNVALHEDVTNVGKHNLPTADIIFGGFPCQDVSVAGQRRGLAGERSGLWFEFARIVSEVKPAWVVIENVPGLLSSNGGRDFAVIVHGLEERGYSVGWRVLDSQFFGVPQRRRRLFIVANSRTESVAKVLFESESMSRDSKPSKAQGKSNAEATTRRTYPTITGTIAASGAGTARPGGQGSEKDLLVYQPVSFGEYREGCTTATLKASDDITTSTLALDNIAWKWNGNTGWSFQKGVTPTLTSLKQDVAVGVRRLTPIETERLQGFPDGWTHGQSDGRRYHQMGNAVTVNVAEWLFKRIVKDTTE